MRKKKKSNFADGEFKEPGLKCKIWIDIYTE
jgi:hypothetical protein